MFNSEELFKKRFSSHMRETSRYLKYIFNGHIAVAMFFLISALAFYYQQFLAGLPENFPSVLIIGIAFGLIVSYSTVRTFLLEPDLVFLMSAEEKMDKYFRNSLAYSFVVQLYQVFLLAAVLGPLYFNAFKDRSGKVYLITILLLVVFKGWNILINWWTSFVRDESYKRLSLLVRTVFNIVIFYFIIELNLLFALIATVLFLVLFGMSYAKSKKQNGINWALLVEGDLKSRQSFYKIANMFTDVPHIKSPVKKRSWLVKLLSKLPMEQKNTYTFLYRLSFARSGDYLGMYLRLFVIGGLAIYFIPNMWVKLGMVVLFLYLSSFQLVTLYDHYRTIVWIDLYPVVKKLRQESLINLLFQLSVVKTIIFAILFIVTKHFLGFLLALAAGLIFSFLFIKGYLNRKILAK